MRRTFTSPMVRFTTSWAITASGTPAWRASLITSLTMRAWMRMGAGAAAMRGRYLSTIASRRRRTVAWARRSVGGGLVGMVVAGGRVIIDSWASGSSTRVGRRASIMGGMGACQPGSAWYYAEYYNSDGITVAL